MYVLTPPPGVTLDYAAVSYGLPDNHPDIAPGATLSANISVFRVDQDCKPSPGHTHQTQPPAVFSLANVIPQDDFDQLSPFYIWVTGSARDDSYIHKTHLVQLDCSINTTKPLASDSLQLFTSVRFDWPGNISTLSALVCRPRYFLTLRQVTTPVTAPH